MSNRQATKVVHVADEERRRYVETYYNRTWADPSHYHIVLNTGLMTFEEASTILEDVASARGWR